MGQYFICKVKHAENDSKLVVGAAYIYNVADQKIVEEVALFLYGEYCIKLGGVLTEVNVENAIWQWLEFNAAAGLNWKEADIQLLLDCRDLMRSTISLTAGLLYAPGTIAARMVAVIVLYKFLSYHGLLTEVMYEQE